MSAAAPAEVPPEIVIVRRSRHVSHDEHHGGVWKIAFADFMTAMMAFFLVMWLINASNEETRSQVASYFNPVRLVDTTASPKGLKAVAPQPSGSESETSEAALETSDAAPETSAGSETERDGADQPKYSEQALFRDPYSVLAEIAGDAGQSPPISENQNKSPSNDPGDAGLTGGDAYRDPFEPSFWRYGATPEPAQTDGQSAQEPQASDKSVAEVAALLEKTDSLQATAMEAGASAPVKSPVKSPEMSPEKPMVEQVDDQTSLADDRLTAADEPAKEKPPEMASEMELVRESLDLAPDLAPDLTPDLAPDLAKAAAEALAAEIETAVSALAPGRKPNIEVAPVEEGVSISLTDEFDFGMFAIGSAEPSPELIRVVDEIAKILKTQRGPIIIRGHTDARPFQSDIYDNWRLSTARAHMARFMLIRGGLSEDRIEHIAGYADRVPKIPEDRVAAQNRRIEIVLKRDSQ